ncbi:hypothetical protein PENSPDRAFT_730389 [Peniophora sp. CONT]|nr:hypothetical protein PENSPDRAFT_730389 [Peniophora sp. CONT]
MVLAQALTFCVRILSTNKHKRHPTWEVVDSKSVDPVHAWDCGDMDDSDVEILAVHDEDLVRSYTFEVRSPGDVSKAVSAAQHRLLQEARSMGYNTLWREGDARYAFTATAEDTAAALHRRVKPMIH